MTVLDKYTTFHQIACYLGHDLYGDYHLPIRHKKDSSLSSDLINVPVSLLSFMQLSCVAYQFWMQQYRDQSQVPHPFAPYLFEQPLKINPLCDDEFNAVYGIETPSRYLPLEKYAQDWHKMMHLLMPKALAGCWTLFIPMLTYSFQYGICPLSFYYYYLTDPHPQKLIVHLWRYFQSVPFCSQRLGFTSYSQHFITSSEYPKKDYLSVIWQENILFV